MTTKPRKDQDPEQDQARIDEVSQGLEAAAPLPPEIVEEVATAEVPDEHLTARKLKQLWEDLKRRELGWKKVLDRVEAQSKELTEAIGKLALDRAAVTASQEALAARDAELARAETEVEKARLDAREGFAEENRAALRDLARQHEQLLQDAAELESKANKKAASILEKARASAAKEDEKLEHERVQIRAMQLQHRLEAEQLANDRALLEAREGLRADQYERRMTTATADLQFDLEDLQDLHQQEQSRREDRDREVSDLRARLAGYGDDPQELLRRRDELTDQVQKLRDELARRPEEAETEEWRSRALRVDAAEAKTKELQQQNNQLDRQLRYQLTAVGELEVLRDERDALLAQRETLRQALEQQRADWEELQSKEGSKEPFPACSLLDREEELRSETATRSPSNLGELVREIRQRMATEPTTAFFYSESDVRIFLAGLAASRLHLLQGISGTGKTSLPREFFKAIGGDVCVVEVQAGWRDKDDLFGYYNAFEKRFAESEFTKALYNALLPTNVDRLAVIVLDEMNLAHPEQYFGTMLSTLENAASEEPFIPLLTSPVAGLPEKFEGSRLPLPPNVWFVGTANHDETTVAFADKTYDRAHVQVLPNRHETFPSDRQGRSDPISFSGLRSQFEAAKRSHRAEVEAGLALLAEGLQDQFAEFGVGWGNRLDRQVKSFVPVVMAADGTLTEAMDHLVCTKVVRKLEDRFGIDPDDLERLATGIEAQWDLDGSSPDKTAKKIRDEATKLRGRKA